MTGDPCIRVVGQVEDMEDVPLVVGVDYHTVTIGRPGDGFPDWRLESHAAEDFARLFVSACWEAAAQSAAMTGAQRAELKAAAEEMCLADCGAPVHDKTCTPQPERNRSQ